VVSRDIYAFGRFRLDPAQRRLDGADNEAVTLTAKAFDALVYLVEHAGEPVSRKALIEALWPDTIVEDNNLTQAISALRGALGQGYVVTLPGRGYQFVGEIRILERNSTEAGSIEQGASAHPAALESPSHGFRWNPRVGAAIAAAIALAALLAWIGAPTWVSVTPNTIAVLPFINLSGDSQEEYFSDGLTEDLLNRLARIQQLRVTGRSSSFYFKNRNEDARAIGKALDVAHLLEGSVRRAGNRLRITAQLVSAADGFQVWSAAFDRDVTDIFAVQDEIAQAVATALSVSLGLGEFSRPGMTRDIKAYDAYLQGMSSFDAGLDDIPAAIEHLRRAVTLDPKFGLAWLKLQEAYSTGRVYLPGEQTGDFQTLALVALQQAEEAAPDMAELLVSRAESERRNGRWLGAENLFLRALDNSGNSNAQANFLYGHLLASAGRSRDALPFLEHARALEPLDPQISTQISRVLVSLQRFEEADAEADRGIAIGNARASIFLRSIKAMSAYSRGDLGLGATWIGALAANNPDDPYFQLANLLATGQADAALARLRVLVEDQTAGPVANSAFSMFASVAGDAELTLKFLQKQANANMNDFFGSNPMWHSFYSDMRGSAGFKELARKGGLVDYWRATAQWGDFCAPAVGDDFECR
jgi:TolB-like protein/DNA-binding winged helix-turn-helix (wHTH) protein